jgi:hypothetical protein
MLILRRIKDFQRSSYCEVIFLGYKSKMMGIESNRGQYENQTIPVEYGISANIDRMYGPNC